jgi:NADH dehydrogenase
VIIGSGFGGLFAARRLKKANAQVTIISRTTHHLFQPLLYQVATAILSEGDVAPATREILRRQKNVEVLLGDVYAIDVANKTVTSTVESITTTTPYDDLIVAAGASTSYFGNDKFELNAPGLKSIDDALEVRSRIFTAFELAELEPDPEIRKELLTFVVVGAGPTGVEMAGQIAELSHRTLPRDFRRIDTATARIILLDALPTVLSSFGLKLSAKAADKLKRLGVNVWLNAKVTDVDEFGLTIEEGSGTKARIHARTVIWAAGVRASTLGRKIAEQTGASVDRGGRLQVEPDMSVPGHPEIFVIGDMMSLNGLPGVAQVAMQGGTYVADTIMRRMAGKPPKKPFKYFDKGSMATISRFSAVVSVGKLRFFGFIAWVMWLVIHVLYLVGFRNRFATLMHWAVSFVGRNRSQRVITHQQLIARAALRKLDVPYLGAMPQRSGDEPITPPATAARRNVSVREPTGS